MSLMVSISGIRGVIGESLTPEVAVRYAAAFGEYCKRRSGRDTTVIIGRDGRVTGSMVTDVITSTLLATGVGVRNLGICPTPTVQLAVEKEGAAGGIAVTASHNPMQWNGMKFIASTGMFLDGDENRVFWGIAEKEPSYVSWKDLGKLSHDATWIRKHIDAVLGLRYLDPATVRARRFKVVLDCVNAAGGVIVPQMLRELGCEVIEMNCEVGGVFAHTPEPIPENLTALAARVSTEHADLGIAVDPDVDRLVLITERGEPYGEEYTVASAVKFVLEREKTMNGNDAGLRRVVVNLSTTRAVEEIASAYRAEVVRTPVGEINVARRMKQIGAVIGGEGSGGVILPAVHLGRDAMVGIGLILQLLAESGGSLSALKKGLPQFSISKGKMEIKGMSPDAVLENIASTHRESGKINTDDGLKIDFRDSWVHLRKSNTEPIIRVIAEARTMKDAADLVEQFKRKVTG